MIQEKIRKAIYDALKALYPKMSLGLDEICVETAKSGFGDFTSNILLKKKNELGDDFKDTIKKLTERIVQDKNLKKYVDKVNGLGGRLNFILKDEYYTKELGNILKQKNKYAFLDILKNKKIQVEYISANPTGPLTLANGRGGFGGDALANVFASCGAKVTREYYVNDGGNQVKILGDSILIDAGLMKSKEDYYRGEYISEWVEGNKKLIEKYKNDSFELGKIAAKDILEKNIKPVTKKMNINFDSWFSEAQLIKKGEVDEAISKLKKYNLTEEKDDALWMKTTKFGDDKDRVLIKGDGEKTYFANDVAYHFDKLYKRKFQKIVNFWGADHHGYVGRMKAAVAAMDCPDSLDIVIFQLVRLIKNGKEFKMSKRKGTYITMDELFELIGGPSADAKGLRDASDVARFFFLSREFNTHMDFDLDLAREHSEKNPVFYVKYAHARMAGILRNASNLKLPKPDLSLLKEKEEQELIKELLLLPNLVSEIASDENYPVHKLTFYSREVASRFHSFYDKCRVINEEDKKTTAARLELVKATQIVLKIVMEDLIGISAPEKM